MQCMVLGLDISNDIGINPEQNPGNDTDAIYDIGISKDIGIRPGKGPGDDTKVQGKGGGEGVGLRLGFG